MHKNNFNLVSMYVPSIAQLVERRTVEVYVDILRSLVRIRLEGIESFFITFLSFYRTYRIYFFHGFSSAQKTLFQLDSSFL